MIGRADRSCKLAAATGVSDMHPLLGLLEKDDVEASAPLYEQAVDIAAVRAAVVCELAGG